MLKQLQLQSWGRPSGLSLEVESSTRIRVGPDLPHLMDYSIGYFIGPVVLKQG